MSHFKSVIIILCCGCYMASSMVSCVILSRWLAGTRGSSCLHVVIQEQLLNSCCIETIYERFHNGWCIIMVVYNRSYVRMHNL